jgi:broad specificity phosphatase PhoE
MKKLLSILLLGCFILAGYYSQAQEKTTTFIIVRHAEKDTSKAGSQMMQADPDLSAAGKVRAQNLVTTLKDYAIDAIYSTNYIRTKATVTPLAEKYNTEIQLYDPRNQQAFAEQLKLMNGKVVVIAGHSNTAPRLVNLLAGTSHPDLADSVYDQYYIVTIKDGVSSVEIKKY